MRLVAARPFSGLRPAPSGALTALPLAAALAISLAMLSVLLLPALSLQAAGVAAGSPALAAQAPRTGGILRVAIPGDPPSLDLHHTTAYLAEIIAWHVFEPLFTYDARYEIVPMLADSYSVSGDGTSYTIRLRSGVRFHDGQEMTAEDVAASLRRWLELSQVGGRYIRPILRSLSATDRYTVRIELTEPSGVLLPALAQPVQMAAIYPARIAQQAGGSPISEFVGTGPFRFVEWQPNRYIRLARFDAYRPRPEPPSGYGGARAAYVDELRFIPVPDVGTRVAGVRTGTYHVATDITTDLYDSLRADPSLQMLVMKPYGWAVAVFNNRKGVMSNPKMRQAFLAALDMDEILAGTFGNPVFYRADPGLLFRETPWWTDAGASRYNQKDPARARRLLQEAGYRGEVVRWVTSQQYDWAYRPALIASEQLKRAGFNVVLEVVDWATVFQRRSNPDLFDVFSTSFIFSPGVSPPTQPVLLNANYPGWWENPEKERLVAQLVREVEPKARYALWARIQELFWEDVPAVKFGDFFNFSVARRSVQNYQNTADMFFWNVWLQEP